MRKTKRYPEGLFHPKVKERVKESLKVKKDKKTIETYHLIYITEKKSLISFIIYQSRGKRGNPLTVVSCSGGAKSVSDK